MRVFKPTYIVNGKPRTGPRWHVGFTDHLEVRRSLAATTDKTASEQFGRNIEQLVAVARGGARPDGDLAKWIEGLAPKLRSKLAGFGLLDEKASTIAQPLTEHVGDYKKNLLAKARTPGHAQLCHTRLIDLLEGCEFAYWRDVNVGKVERWLAEQRAAGTKTRTSNHYAGAVRAFCNWMVADGRASSSPLSRLGSVAVTDEESYGAFTVEQMQKLLEETRVGPTRASDGKPRPRRRGMSGPHRRLLYRFAVETALRADEIRTLTVASFKLDGDPPTVELKARDAKNRRAASIPLRASLVDELREHLAAKLPTASAFAVPRTIAKVVRADLIAAGLPTRDEDGLKLVFHSFRHTTGSWLAAEGLPLKVVQRVLRHQTFKLTADRYTHVERQELVEALESLPDLDSRATGTDGANPTYAHLPRAVSDHGQNRPVSGVAEGGSTGSRGTAKPYRNRGETDRAGFEPAVPLSRHAGLANRCLQPLGHLSCEVRIVPPHRGIVKPRLGRPGRRC